MTDSSDWHSGPVASRTMEGILKEIIQVYNLSRGHNPAILRIPKPDERSILKLATTFAQAGQLRLFTGNSACMGLAESLMILPKIKKLQGATPA